MTHSSAPPSSCADCGESLESDRGGLKSGGWLLCVCVRMQGALCLCIQRLRLSLCPHRVDVATELGEVVGHATRHQIAVRHLPQQTLLP